jgi:DNA-binding IclR family transcriptional regulator
MVRMHGGPIQPATVQAVRHCLALIDVLAQHGQARGVTELSAELHLAKSTIYRMLQTLVAHGYAVQEPASGRYRLGLKFLELGALVLNGLSIRTIAQPHLQALMEKTRETVQLGLLEGHEVVYADKIESQQTIRMYSRVGRRSPLHCTALGKSLLAYQPEETVRAVLAGALRRYTPHTITAASRLREELQRIREEGYALDNEEFEEGLRCVAAPVRDHTEAVAASLGVAGPAARLGSGQLAALVKYVREAADAVSAALGYRTAGPHVDAARVPSRRDGRRAAS